MQLKWGRGFFRAWAVVSVLWILFTGWNEYKYWVMHPDEAECEAPTSILAKWEAELISSDAVYALSLLVLPPIALLIAGFIFGWISKGFRTSA
jgi:hypothetical protein